MVTQNISQENTTVLELFAGCGGLGLGFERSGGYRLIGAYDVSEAACRNYGRVLPGHRIEQVDLTALDPHTLPDADMIIGGPPCQAFSEGNADRPGEKSDLNLWPTTLNIVKVKRPARFLFENVRGLVKDHPAYFWSLLNNFQTNGLLCGLEVAQRRRLRGASDAPPGFHRWLEAGPHALAMAGADPPQLSLSGDAVG